MIRVTPKIQIPMSFKGVIECLRDGGNISTVDLFSGRSSGKTYTMREYAI